MTKCLFIGDPHFQISNLDVVDMFIKEITEFLKNNVFDFVVVAGDILHTHERIHSLVLNKACRFIKTLCSMFKTFILVGNHDYISNTQFLTDNHWMNSMKEWNNVSIVDKPTTHQQNGKNFLFVPYVFPGRFKEAIKTHIDNWDDYTCIFAHQEFKGCKMGAITSETGDVWEKEDCLVVSGHIHSKQRPQTNIFYPGTPFQHSFGDTGNNVIVEINFHNACDSYDIIEHKMNLPGKKTLYLDIDSIRNFSSEQSVKEEEIKISLKCTNSEFKTFKNSYKYKELTKLGLKIIHKSQDTETKNIKSNDLSSDDHFDSRLKDTIIQKQNPYLTQAYELIINNQEIDTGDIFYL